MVARRILIFGSTGSIALRAVDVGEGDEVITSPFSFVASANVALYEKARPVFADIDPVTLNLDPDAAAAAEASRAWPDGEVLSGPDGVAALVAESGPDLVLNAIVGSAGLLPTIATLGEGIDLALANKESLVAGGELVMALAEATGAQILPVDSEHAALHQLIAAERAAGPGTIERLTITASGGPFRGMTGEQLASVSVADALKHPTWEMGGKITIDSATLMNKGLELIEAHHLFGVRYEQIDVVVHPQSIIHGCVALCDGAVLAHLGLPDMRVPIAYALHHPNRTDLPVARLDLIAAGSLTFEPVDLEAFPCLRLAREAGLAGGTAPCILNAANEIAVHAFLSGRIAFTRIAEVIEATLESLDSRPLSEFEILFAADRTARETARGFLA